MGDFKNFIELKEAFTNAVGERDRAVKEKYKQQVWDLLQKSYAAIGGIKGSGFSSADEMVDKIPMWKMIARNGVVHAVVLYKDKGGRKSVAMGSDGSDFARKHIASLAPAELTRSYAEKSKAALGLQMKSMPWDVLKSFTHTATEAARIIKDPITAIKSVPRAKWPKDAQLTLAKYPQLIDYGYLREIGGTQVFKVMFGSPGHSIR